MTPRAHIAAIRFGLGIAPAAPPPDAPEPWLTGQLRPLPAAPGPSLDECLTALRARRDPASTENRPADIARAEAQAWARRMLTTQAPLAERLAEFWGNHFTISRRRGNIIALLGVYQREAIRPHIMGRFEEMLLAVTRHPGMLMYLDNANSIGPNSMAGLRQGRGLNENLAREILELHTLGVNGGYTQDDVTNLARILTGWSVGRGAEFNEPAGFMFRPRTHEPGAKTLLGRSFPEGEEGGAQALRFLAAHPATQRHLAEKLARQFIADAPPPAVKQRIAQTLAETQGDLAATMRRVIAMPEAWSAPLSKLRAPQDYVLAVLRATGVGELGAQAALGAAAQLAQPLWTAPAPNGWPDTAADWATPEQMMRRLDWANTIAGRAAATRDARMLAEATLGPLLRAETATAIRRAASPREGLVLLLASPEFHRR